MPLTFGVKMSVPDKKLLKWMWRLFLFFYIPFFLVLWLGGGYVATQSGKARSFMGIPTGISVTDVAAWQPFIGHFQSSYTWPDGDVSPRCGPIGWAYFPMFYVIERYNPPIRLITEEGEIIQSPDVPHDLKIHPWRGGFLRSVLPTKTGTEQDADRKPDNVVS